MILCTLYKNLQLIYILLSCTIPLVAMFLLLLSWMGVKSSVWLLVIELWKCKNNCDLAGGGSESADDNLSAISFILTWCSYNSTSKLSTMSIVLQTPWSESSSSSSSRWDIPLLLKCVRWLLGPIMPSNTGSNSRPWNNPNKTTPMNTYRRY